MGELVHETDITWADLDTPVEQATKVSLGQLLSATTSNLIVVIDRFWTSQCYPLARARR